MILRRWSSALSTVFVAALLVFAVPAGQALAGTVPPPYITVLTGGQAAWGVPALEDLWDNTLGSAHTVVSGCIPNDSTVTGCVGASLEGLTQVVGGYNIGKSVLSGMAAATKWFFTGDPGGGDQSSNDGDQTWGSFVMHVDWPNPSPTNTTGGNCAADGCRNMTVTVTNSCTNGSCWGASGPTWTSTCESLTGGQEQQGNGFGGGRYHDSTAWTDVWSGLDACSGLGPDYYPVDITVTFNPGNGYGQFGSKSTHWSTAWRAGAATGGGTPDPSTPIHQKVSCLRPDGSFYTVETDGVLGAMGAAMTIPLCTAGGYDSADRPVDRMCQYDLSTDKPQQTVRFCGSDGANAQPQYPLCAGTAYCNYTLSVDGTVCTVGDPQCITWTSTYAQDPSRVVCKWGPYRIDLSRCGFLERAFEVNGPSEGCAANLDGNPATTCGPPPPAASVPPVPAPSGGSTGGSSCTPSTDAGAAGCGTDTSPPVTPDNSNSCYPSGWSAFNPLEWIVRPIKCVLTWALVPSPGAVTAAFQGFSDVWKKSPPGAVVTSVTPVMAGIGSGYSGASSCGSMPDFSVPGAEIHLPCTMAAVGPGSAIYTLVQAVLVVTTAIYLWGMVSSMLGASGGVDG